MMDRSQIIRWLLEGDQSIQYQVYRDLLGTERRDLQDRICSEGWGKSFLSMQKPNGHWGDRFYQPKWISTHYTLLDLRHLCLPPDNDIAREAVERILQSGKAEDGGIQLGPSTSKHSDVCVNGMFLNYASYFRAAETELHSVLESLLFQIMPDGGFNCRTADRGSRHSSLHTTLSVLEGLNEFLNSGYKNRTDDVQKAIQRAEEFILSHQLYLSDRTGRVISENFLKMSFPTRWKYDIFRALDYFRQAKRSRDNRMDAAIQVLIKKRNREGTWNLPAAHPGQVHFIMEKAGKPSRWNTLRAMRILEYFEDDENV